MKQLLAVKTLLLAAACSLFWSCSAPRMPTLAITHVTVIDATGAPTQQDMTLLTADQRITAVGPSGSTAIPRGAQILDATGKFLIPGLADMHVHLTGAGEPTGSREFIIPLLLASGVTTVRDMGGNVEDLLRLRNEISSGIRLGPQISFTGSYLDGDPPAYQPSIVVKTSTEARAAVDRLALLAAAAALRQSAPEVATLFARTRLEDGHGAMYGTSRIAPDEARRLIDRALP